MGGDQVFLGKTLDLKKFSLGDSPDEIDNTRRTVGTAKASSELDKKRGRGRGNSADRLGRATVKEDDE